MCGRVAVIGYPTQVTNQALVHAWRDAGVDALLLEPRDAISELGLRDTALVRLDVLRTLDGVEPGLQLVNRLESRGVSLLNRPAGLLGAHDKLMTARRLHSAGIPHPRTAHVTSAEDLPHLEPPVVVKPRFGSWGLDVFRCENATELQRCLLTLEDRSWFRRQGALVQEVVSTGRQDLQLIAAGGHVVGAALRAAAPGEWRTNVSLGGTFAPTVPEAQASRLATAAAAAIGIDLGGVDLVYTDAGSVMVLELNAAAEFDDRYSLPSRHVLLDAADALGLLPHALGPAAEVASAR